MTKSWGKEIWIAIKSENGSLFLRFDFRFLTPCAAVAAHEAPSFVYINRPAILLPLRTLIPFSSSAVFALLRKKSQSFLILV